MVRDASSAGTGPEAVCWLWWQQGGQHGQALGLVPADSNLGGQGRGGMQQARVCLIVYSYSFSLKKWPSVKFQEG